MLESDTSGVGVGVGGIFVGVGEGGPTIGVSGSGDTEEDEVAEEAAETE
jgi:hypothetical protein